jgi:hypothetical protein
MLFVPNAIWARRKPEGYSPAGENRVLLVLERAGQVCVTCAALIFSDFNPRGWSLWSLWLIAAFLVMVVYECWWIRYFRSAGTLRDFYSSFLGAPVAGAILPVMAFLLLSVYGKVIWLALSVVVLGIGHIGIHIGHSREINA